MFFKVLITLGGLVTLAYFGLTKGYCQTRLIQAIPTKSFGFLPLLVAQQRGLYQAEGLEVLAPVMKCRRAWRRLFPARCILPPLTLQCARR